MASSAKQMYRRIVSLAEPVVISTVGDGVVFGVRAVESCPIGPIPDGPKGEEADHAAGALFHGRPSSFTLNVAAVWYGQAWTRVALKSPVRLLVNVDHVVLTHLVPVLTPPESAEAEPPAAG